MPVRAGESSVPRAMPRRDHADVTERSQLDHGKYGGNATVRDGGGRCGFFPGGGTALSPHFSPGFCCGGGYRHVYCVALGRAPRRSVHYVSGALGRAPCIHARLHRLATNPGVKCGLVLRFINTVSHRERRCAAPWRRRATEDGGGTPTGDIPDSSPGCGGGGSPPIRGVPPRRRSPKGLPFLLRQAIPGLHRACSPRVSLVSRRNPSGNRPPAAALECNRICETENFVLRLVRRSSGRCPALFPLPVPGDRRRLPLR